MDIRRLVASVLAALAFAAAAQAGEHASVDEETARFQKGFAAGVEQSCGAAEAACVEICGCIGAGFLEMIAPLDLASVPQAERTPERATQMLTAFVQERPEEVGALMQSCGFVPKGG